MRAKILASTLLACTPLLALAEPQSAAKMSGSSYQLYVSNPDAHPWACKYEVTLTYGEAGQPKIKRYVGDFVLRENQPPSLELDLHTHWADLTEVKPPDVHCVTAEAGGAPIPVTPAAPMEQPAAPTSESPMTPPPSQMMLPPPSNSQMVPPAGAPDPSMAPAPGP